MNTPLEKAGFGKSGLTDIVGASRRGKAAGAFRTISEVASDLDVPQHVLRFWETRFAQIRPLKRAGGRRYYRPEDVDLLRRIRQLLYNNGYTIKGVQKLLRDVGRRPEGEEPPSEAVAPVELPPEGLPETEAVPSALPEIDAAIDELAEIRDLLRKRGR